MSTIAEKALMNRFNEVKKSDFDPANFRLSNTGKCERMRMLKVLGYSSEDVDQSTAETFERGNLIEDWLVEQFIKRFPRKTRKQIEVHTPYGDVGHMDIWFPNPEDKEPTIIEVKSVHEKARYYLPKEDHINQVQAYMHFFTDSQGKRKAKRAEITYIFFGRKLESVTYEIKYNELTGRKIEKELIKLHKWKEEGYIPGIAQDKSADQFPCFWLTSDGSSGNCSFYEHCWSGEMTGEYEDIPVFDDDPVFRDLLDKYQNIKESYKTYNKEISNLKKQKSEIEKVIDKNLKLRNTDKAVVGNISIKKTEVGGRIYWKPERALKQGLIDEETLEKIKGASDRSSGYTRFYLKNIERGEL